MKVGIRLPLRRGQGLAAADQLRVLDQEAQCRVLEHHDQLADDRRQHEGDGLGQQHHPQRLERGQPDGQAGLALAVGQRPDPRADQLGDHAGVVEGQPGDHSGEGQDVARDLEAEEEHVEGEQHHHQHRDRPEELHEDAAGPAHPTQLGQPAHAEQDAADHREDDREERGHQGGPQAGQQVGGPGHRLQERAPLGRGELVLRGQGPDQQEEQGSDGQPADDRDDRVAGAGPWDLGRRTGRSTSALIGAPPTAARGW